MLFLLLYWYINILRCIGIYVYGIKGISIFLIFRVKIVILNKMGLRIKLS